MPLEILPSTLYSLPSCELVLQSKKSSLFHKSLSSSLVNKKMYLSTMAILLVEKGEQIVHNYDGSKLTVAENEIVILPKDIYVVSDFVTEQELFEASIFFIDEELIKKFLLFYTEENKYENSENKLCKVFSNSEINDYICSLFTTYRKYNLPSLHEVKIIEFLLLLVNIDKNKYLVSSFLKPVRKRGIKKFMDDNYLGSLKVNDYASLTGRSVSTFNREFKRIYGTTPNKWLTHKRLEKSSELLKDTNMTVTEVSMEIGYENVSHFIKAYKQLFGNTPRRHKSENSD